MIDQLKTRTPRHVAVAALVLTGLGFILGGTRVGAWRTALVAAGLLGAKLVVLLAVCWALLARWGVDPLGFSVGLGALVLGMLYAGADLSIREAQSERNTQAAGER